MIALAGSVGAITIQDTSAQAQTVSVVSPSIYQDVDAPGASGDGWPFASRSNFIFHKSEFADLPAGGAMLSEVSFRPDRNSRIGDEVSFGRIEISVAVTPVEPQDISLTYAENIAAAISAPVVVYEGPWSTPVTSDRPQGNEARPFEHRVILQNLFDYDPADGNLLVDWIFEAPSHPVGSVDLARRNDTPHEVHAHVWGSADDANASSNQGVYSVMTELSFVSHQLAGDFDGDNVLTAADIDLLANAIRGRSDDTQFDLNDDASVDQADHRHWVTELEQTWFGDSNLDGEFNSGDLVQVFATGHYEDDIAMNSGWAEGDWNGDGEFDSGDLVLAFQDGGFELGPRDAQAATVPEPATNAWLVASTVGFILYRRRI